MCDILFQDKALNKLVLNGQIRAGYPLFAVFLSFSHFQLKNSTGAHLPGTIRFTARSFRKLLSIYVFSYFPFGFEDRVWDLIVSVPGHCLSFYFSPMSQLICLVCI